jgi:hypothetical protein
MATTVETDWLDLSDPRSTANQTATPLPQTPTADINKAFDEISALFEVYPEVKPDKKASRKKGKSMR